MHLYITVSWMNPVYDFAFPNWDAILFVVIENVLKTSNLKCYLRFGNAYQIIGTFILLQC